MANHTTIPLVELIQKVETHLQISGYTAGSIKRYQDCWKILLKNYRCKELHLFSYDLCMEMIEQHYRIPSTGKMKHCHRFYIRTVKALQEFWLNGQISRCHQRSGKHVNAVFTEVLSYFVSTPQISGLSGKTITTKTIQVTHFLNFLCERNIYHLGVLSAECILAYTKGLSDTGYARSTRSGILFTLRAFLLSMYNCKCILEPLHELFPVIYSNKKERIPSYYSEDEQRKILLHIDRDDMIGKRDYLILLLAVQLGIRAGDIRLLKFESVHWEKKTIEFIQQKTRNAIQLPLPENIHFALIDYIKNGRPISTLPYIFIRHRAPFEAFSKASVFHSMLTRYLNDSEISFSGRKHGLHSMRHSLASNLLKNNTPYPVITGILGHENTNTTRMYLSIDIDQLRSVALEVPYEE